MILPIIIYYTYTPCVMMIVLCYIGNFNSRFTNTSIAPLKCVTKLINDII